MGREMYKSNTVEEGGERAVSDNGNGGCGAGGRGDREEGRCGEGAEGRVDGGCGEGKEEAESERGGVAEGCVWGKSEIINSGKRVWEAFIDIVGCIMQHLDIAAQRCMKIDL